MDLFLIEKSEIAGSFQLSFRPFPIFQYFLELFQNKETKYSPKSYITLVKILNVLISLFLNEIENNLSKRLYLR